MTMQKVQQVMKYHRLAKRAFRVTDKGLLNKISFRALQVTSTGSAACRTRRRTSTPAGSEKGFQLVSARTPQYEGEISGVTSEKLTTRRDLAVGAKSKKFTVNFDAYINHRKLMEIVCGDARLAILCLGDC